MDQQLDVAALRAEIDVTSHRIDQRKAWLGLDDGDVGMLGRIDEVVAPEIGVIVDSLVDDLAHRNGSARTTGEGRRLLCDYFGGLTSADGFGDAFVDRRLTMVDALRRTVNPDVSWYLAAYLFYLDEVGTLLRAKAGDKQEMQTLYRSLARATFLDLSLAIDVYVFERDRTIRAQQRALEELSTPVLQLRDGLLILPIVGMLDSRRAQQLTEQLLQAIRDRRGKVVVLDVTGVAAVDSRVANHLIQTVDAARLMGATAIVSGVSVEVAQTLVGLGIGLGNVITVAELQDGVDAADRVLGLRIVRVDQAPVEDGQG
ncbi:MAG TPA: protoglobin domain-containing protein [Acidimicrobiales bacterium]|nr:protoglobin domain-containing protein [Acidimicrobiales bacterium]